MRRSFAGPVAARAAVVSLMAALLASLVPLVSTTAVGPASVTPATGGSAISADDAGTAWTTLTGPVITENTAGNFSGGTVVLNAPGGFRFRAGFGSVAKSGAGCNLTATALTVVAATATFSIGASPSTVATCVFTYSALQVQPTTGIGLGSANITRTGTATGLPGGNYGTLTLVAGAPATLKFVSYPGASTPALLTPQPQVAIVDAHGNQTDATPTITLAINNNLSTFSCFGQAFGTGPSIVAVAGIATFTGCTQATVANGYVLTANDGPGPLPPVTGSTFNVTSGIASRLAMCWGPTSPCVITPPGPFQGGTPFATQPVVRVQDSLGNTVPTDNTTQVGLSILAGTPASGGPGTLTCSSGTVTVVAGVGTFAGCRIDKRGTAYRLMASSSPVLTAATSNAFDVVPGPPVKLGFLTQPTTVSAGAPITPPISVAIQDAGGNTVVTGYTASIQLGIGANPAAGVLACGNNNTATTVGGIATYATCVINAQGSGYTLVATALAVSPTVALSPAQTNPFAVLAPLAAITVTPSSAVITWGQDVTLSIHFATNGANKTFALQVSKDGTTWSTIGGAGSLVTDGVGNTSFLYGPSDNRYYRVQFGGSPDLQAGTSPIVRVVVRQTNQLRPANNGTIKQISHGTTITFKSTIRPNRPELPQARANFVVYQLVGPTWIRIANVIIGVDRSDGVATFSRTFSSVGRYYVRSQAVPTPFNANSGWSPVEQYRVV